MLKDSRPRTRHEAEHHLEHVEKMHKGHYSYINNILCVCVQISGSPTFNIVNKNSTNRYLILSILQSKECR